MPNANLLSLFTDDIGTAERLLKLLEEEFGALETQDLPRLQTLLDAKMPLLSQLEQHGRQRSAFLRQAGVSQDREGLAQIAASQPEGAQWLEQGDVLAALLERCRQANQRNGRVIRTNQASTGRLLEIIRGQDTPSLYDRRGGATQGNRQRPLSQA
ncbi:MAG: hypothetical protein GAK43_01837 [Stenotrophomonas maltophilia]|nr:MAG: hypothetical protein GAK43_01837 [Stenotrophomonas maltophilia]